MKKKKKGKTKKYKNELKKSILIFIMLLCAIIAMITYWIYAYNHKHDNINNEDKVISYRVKDYVEVKGDIVYLKNIDETIKNNFENSQKNILNTKNVSHTDITRQLYDGILSVKISYTILDNSAYEKVLTLNIDLREDKIIDNEVILDMVGKTYREIAEEIFEEYVKLPEDNTKTVKDSISEEVLTFTEFNKNSEKYIIRIREKLPSVIKTYIHNDNVYYVVELSEINEICYYKNTDNNKIIINKNIGKI